MEQIRPHLKIVTDFLIEQTPIEELPNTDGIFVFGHIDPRLPKHAAQLWKLGKAPRIIITGKGRLKIPENLETEADFYASIIRRDNIPDNALVLEKQATNTLENVIFGIRICQQQNFNPKSLILCSMPFLLRRSIATFQKQFPEIRVFGSTLDIQLDEYLTLPGTSLNIKQRIERILAELNRFTEYAKKGDIVPVQVPDTVAKAAAQIRSML